MYDSLHLKHLNKIRSAAAEYFKPKSFTCAVTPEYHFDVVKPIPTTLNSNLEHNRGHVPAKR